MEYITALADLVQGLNAMSDARFYVLIAVVAFAIAAWAFAKSAPAGFKFLTVVVRHINVRIALPAESRQGKSQVWLRLCVGLAIVLLATAPALAVLSYAGVLAGQAASTTNR